MEDDNELPADEILGRYGDTKNFHLDNIIDPSNDDGEINLIKPSPYFGIDCLPHRGGTPYVMGDTYVPRFWPPFFTLAGSSTIFLGYFFLIHQHQNDLLGY